MRNMDLLVKRLKNKILLMFIAGIFIFLSIGDVKAFPGNLTSIFQSGSSVYGSLGSYKAAYKKSLEGYAVFCTKYNSTTPASGRRTCSLTDNWNVATRAGVAYLIGDNYISNGLGKANSAYVDIELAISEFLYITGAGGDNISDRRVQYSWVNTAVAIYNNVNYAVNNISVSIGSVSTSQDENNYYLSIPITYSNANGSYVSVSKGGTTYSKIGNNYVIPKNTLSEGNNTINISATATYTDWQARQYNCGGDRQPVTPNYRELTQLASRTATKSINLPKESKGSIKIQLMDEGYENESYTHKEDDKKILGSGKFQIYNGPNCEEGNEILPDGERIILSNFNVMNNLRPGVYSIKEKEGPDGYQKSSRYNDDSCVEKNVNVVAGKTIDVNIYYRGMCNIELEKLNKEERTPENLINLYKKLSSYGEEHRGLLDFDNPRCKFKIDEECPRVDFSELSCLEGNNNLNSDFNENNLSCYDKKVDENGSLGFCLNTFKLENKLNTSTFYNKSGQFLIKRENDESGNYYQLYNDNLEPIKIPGNYIASSTTTKICYIYNKENYDDYDNIKESSIFFGDNDGDTKADKLKFDIIKTPKNPVDVDEYFRKYEYVETKNYFLNPVYLKRLTGKYSSTKDTDTISTPVYGILSNFNTTNGVIPFELSYDGKNYKPDTCKYETKQEIITYDENKNGNLKLEFRQINTSNPFPGKSGNTRKIGKNWYETDENGNVTSRSSNPEENNLINNVIINRNNSYNKNKVDNPLYKIELTPSLINKIRNYNESHPYDEYNVECDEEGKCTNAFLKEYNFVKIEQGSK